MNRKTIVTAVAMLACGAALATVETTNTLCRIRIDSNRKETILSIPLIAVGTDGTSSPTNSVTKYVLTDGLQSGDKLLLKHDGVWEAWTFNGTAWSGGTTVSGDTVTPSSSTLPFGDCIRLIRSDTTKPIYLYGELPKNSAKIQTASAGVWTVLGNAKPEAVTLSTFTGKCTVKPASGDAICLWADNSSKTQMYTYNGTSWVTQTWSVDANGVLSATETNSDSVEISAGEGFWYVRKSGDALSVNWE